MLTPEEVTKLAVLARMELSETERQTFGREMESILAYVSEVQKLASGEDAPQGEPQENRNVLREDEDAHEPGLYTERLLALAPLREGAHIRVKKIL